MSATLDTFTALEELSNGYEDVIEEKVPVTSFNWVASEFPKLTYIATQLERMGFTMARYNDTSTIHIWVNGIWECHLGPMQGTVRLDYLQPSGNLYSEKVISLEKNTADFIIREIANSFFFFGDTGDIHMMETDKIGWNKRYAKTHGQW